MVRKKPTDHVPSARGQGARTPAPDLHQANKPYQRAVASQGRPAQTHARSYSSQPPEPTPMEVIEKIQQLSVQSEVAPGQESPSPMRFPLRPSKGSTGTRCIVKANHFFAELLDKDLHQYDVSITPEVTSRVMEQLVKLYKESHLGKRLHAYDGRKSLYTAGPLPFASKESIDEEDGPVPGARVISRWLSSFLQVPICIIEACFYRGDKLMHLKKCFKFSTLYCVNFPYNSVCP